MAEDVSDDELFQFVWDDTFHGYYIVSNHVFPLNVYVLSLSDVGNFRASNHSAVVEGVKEAVKICPGDSQTKELFISLGFDLAMKLKVNVSYVIVEDWTAYETLVESGNSTIIVNTHDEYLSVPNGYEKEEWVDKIADFMLNRWGTWVHTGGYPLYRVWYQNGTTEEWGELGFKHFMNYVGKGNVTCYPSTNWHPEDPATFSVWASQNLGINWFLYENPISTFHYANPGNPIDYNDFKEHFVDSLYDIVFPYYTGAIVQFALNESAFNFGIYVHLGAWQFFAGGGQELPSDLAMGFVSTAAAVYGEFFCAASKLYSEDGGSAAEAIQKAEKEGRTNGLAEAKSLFQNALDAFESGNYKLSATYANQARLTAEKATASNILLVAIAAVGVITTSIGAGAYYKINNKKNKRKASECAE